MMNEQELKNEVDRLSSKHRELMRWLISGATHAEAAARTGINKKNVSRLAGSELFKSEMKRLQDKLDEDLHGKKVSTQAEIVEMNLLEHKKNLETRIEIRDKELESPASRLKACDAIDEIAGLKKLEVKDQRVTLEMGDGWKAMLSDALLGDKEVAGTTVSVSTSTEGKATTGTSDNATG